MAHVVIVIDAQNQSISQLNDKLGLVLPVGASEVNPDETMAKIANYIAACQGSSVDAAVQVTVRDTDPSVSTSGSGSLQREFTLSGLSFS
jgi:hypothetical protein